MSSWGHIWIRFPGCDDEAFEKIMEVIGVTPTEQSYDEWDPDLIINAYQEALHPSGKDSIPFRKDNIELGVSTREHFCDREAHVLTCDGRYGDAPTKLVDMLYELFDVTVVMEWCAPPEDGWRPRHFYMCSNDAEVTVDAYSGEREIAQGLIGL